MFTSIDAHFNWGYPTCFILSKSKNKLFRPTLLSLVLERLLTSTTYGKLPSFGRTFVTNSFSGLKSAGVFSKLLSRICVFLFWMSFLFVGVKFPRHISSIFPPLFGPPKCWIIFDIFSLYNLSYYYSAIFSYSGLKQ